MTDEATVYRNMVLSKLAATQQALESTEQALYRVRNDFIEADTLNKVAQFHVCFEFPEPPSTPQVMEMDDFAAGELAGCARLLKVIERRLKQASRRYSTPPQCLLHPQLQVSELSELLDAMARRDMVDALDACCDIRYVNDGATRMLGLRSVFYTAFGLVHDSNMSKLGPDGLPVKDHTGKVVKGDWYKPVQLEHLIYGENKNE